MGQKFKGQKRCIISNKLINGKEVVITDYAVDYVKKMGFIVINKNKIENYQRNLITASLFILILFMLPMISPKLLTEADAQIIFNNNTYNNNSYFNVSNFITNITNITNITQLNITNITNNTFINVSKDTRLIIGRSTASISQDAYLFAGGGQHDFNENDRTQLLRMDSNGILHNLTFIMSANQSAIDVCVLYVNKNSSFGTTSTTSLFANISGVKQLAINLTASVNVSKGDYIKMFFDEQAGACQGQLSWSLVYELI